MAMPDFYAKVGETLDLAFQLTGRTKLPQDLTDATSVNLTVRDKITGAVVIDRVACTFVSNALGSASYVSPAVIAFPAGWYELDVTANYPGGIVHKFPNRGSSLLLVSPKLA